MKMVLRQTRGVAGISPSLGQVAMILALALGLGGCKTASIKNPGSVIGPFHKPANYNLADGVMPADMRRVALLPMTSAFPR